MISLLCQIIISLMMMMMMMVMMIMMMASSTDKVQYPSLQSTALLQTYCPVLFDDTTCMSNPYHTIDDDGDDDDDDDDDGKLH